MRTTVTLDEELVDQLQRVLKARTKTAAVTQAVREQIRRTKLRKLADILGTVEIDEAAIRRGEKADRKREKLLGQPRKRNG